MKKDIKGDIKKDLKKETKKGSRGEVERLITTLDFGVLVRIITKDNSEFKGLLLKSPDDNVVIIKLSNGYNVGIAKDNIKDIVVEEENSKVKGKSNEVNEEGGNKEEKFVDNNDNKPRVVILHTGGTIASRVDYKTGAVVASYKPEDLLRMFPELEGLAIINSELISNLMSENMRPEHYNIIAEHIKAWVDKGVDGVIITHGTDTMHYTSAALNFILENLSVPVVLVGAQRSSDRPSSDASYNLLNAVFFVKEAVKNNVSGVFVCMHETMDDPASIIIHGCKVRKMHSSRRDAFKPINTKAIARVDYKKNHIEWITPLSNPHTNSINSNTLSKQGSSSKHNLVLKKINPNIKVGLLKAHPGLKHEIILSFKGYDGLVLEGTGLGHFPIIKTDDYNLENEKVFNALKELSKDTLLVMSSQTIFGRVDMNVYSPGRKLLEIGVLGNYSDMTPETTLIKLWWLLSNYSKEEIREKNLIMKNFRGEVSTRTTTEFLD